MVTLAIATGPSGAMLGGTVCVAAIKGVATFKNLKLTTAGTYTLFATDSADKLTSAASAKFVVSPAAAGKLAFIQQPTNTTAGHVISPAITVAVEDKFGNIVTNDNSNVILAVLDADPHCCIFTVHAHNGLATFSNLCLNAAGTYRLMAIDWAIGITSSNSFTVTPGRATHMQFVCTPCDRTQRNEFAVQVVLLDEYGNVATGDSSSVTLSLGTHPKNSVLSGQLTAPVINGIAVFRNVSVNLEGTYSLLASDRMDGIAASSSRSFRVSW
jgi:S-adenosylmethionine hydrolase